MRLFFVWLTASILIFSISLGWYVSLPVVLGVSRNLNFTNPTGQNIATAVEYSSYAWGPLFCAFIFLWAVISSAKRDVESEVYG